MNLSSIYVLFAIFIAKEVCAEYHEKAFSGQFLKYNSSSSVKLGEVLKCNILKLSHETPSGTRLTPEHSESLIELPMPKNTTCFSFMAKAEQSVKVIISEETRSPILTAEIYMLKNGDLNYISTIFDHSINKHVKESTLSGILDDNQFWPFYVTFEHNIFEIFSGVNNTLIMRYQVPVNKKLEINFIGFQGLKDTPIEWLLPEEPQCSKNSSAHLQKAQVICTSARHVEAVRSFNNGTSIGTDLVAIQKDLLNQISSDFKIFLENTNGTSTNKNYTLSHLRELDDIFYQAKSNHKRILYNQDTTNRSDYLSHKIYLDIKSSYFNFLKAISLK